MPLIQQITSIININLLYAFSKVMLVSLLTNHILRNTIKSNYRYWTDGLFITGSCLIALVFQDSEILVVLMLFWGLFILSLMDIFYRILPDIINFPLLFLGLALSVQSQFVSIVESLLGVLGGYIILWGISLAYKNMSGQCGMGKGDLKLTAALGAWIGFEGVLYLLFWSSLLGCGFYGVMAMRGKYNRMSRIPFGLFLSIVGMSIFIMRFSSWRL